jgi:hypothetical protein
MAVTVTKNWLACMNDIAAALSDQDITDIGADVTVQKDALGSNEVRPGCYVTPSDRNVRTGTCGMDDVGYGCLIAVIGGSTLERSEDPERVTSWQEVVSKLFNNKRLPNPEVRSGDLLLPCWVEDAPADWNVIQRTGKKVEGVAIVIRARIREQRT